MKPTPPSDISVDIEDIHNDSKYSIGSVLTKLRQSIFGRSRIKEERSGGFIPKHAHEKSIKITLKDDSERRIKGGKVGIDYKSGSEIQLLSTYEGQLSHLVTQLHDHFYVEPTYDDFQLKGLQNEMRQVISDLSDLTRKSFADLDKDYDGMLKVMTADHQKEKYEDEVSTQRDHLTSPYINKTGTINVPSLPGGYHINNVSKTTIDQKVNLPTGFHVR